MKLQIGEVTETVKAISSIESVTTIGLLLLMVVGLAGFSIYLLRKIDKTQETERQREVENVKLFMEIGNSINETKQVGQEIKGVVKSTNEDTKEVLVYIKNLSK
jgi:flagellar biogenesis protein FliO